MSAGSRSTTCMRWIVSTPCRRRSVLLPRQCLQMTRPLPRHTSHSLVKISPISRKNWPYTMANDATCARSRSLFRRRSTAHGVTSSGHSMPNCSVLGEITSDSHRARQPLLHARCTGVRHRSTSVQQAVLLSRRTVLSPRTTSRMGSGLSIALGRQPHVQAGRQTASTQQLSAAQTGASTRCTLCATHVSEVQLNRGAGVSYSGVQLQSFTGVAITPAGDKKAVTVYLCDECTKPCTCNHLPPEMGPS